MKKQRKHHTPEETGRNHVYDLGVLRPIDTEQGMRIVVSLWSVKDTDSI